MSSGGNGENRGECGLEGDPPSVRGGNVETV